MNTDLGNHRTQVICLKAPILFMLDFNDFQLCTPETAGDSAYQRSISNKVHFL